MNLYKEEILELYQNPLNWGTISQPDIDVYEVNQLCGDSVRIQVKLKKQKIAQVKFRAQGCVVAVAASSILTEIIKEKSLKEVGLIKKEKLLKALGINPNPARLKCALLGLEALRRGIEEYEARV